MQNRHKTQRFIDSPVAVRASTLVAYGGGEEGADFGVCAEEARRFASGNPFSSDYWLPHCPILSHCSDQSLYSFFLGGNLCFATAAEETLVPLRAT